MADIISTIGAGQTYETISAWVSARASNGDRWIGELTDAADYVAGEYSGTNNGDMVLRADPSVAFDFDNPSAPHARIYSASTNAIYIRFTTPFYIEGVELRTDSITSTCINSGVFEACDLTTTSCLISGGKNGIGAIFDGAVVNVNNSVVTGTQEWGIRGDVAGVGATNTSVVGCNVANVNFRGGIQSTAGSSWDSVVAYDNNSPDWFEPAGTFVNCGSGDTSATGTGNVQGVTDLDFTNYASGIFTAAPSGVLFEAGTNGTNIGYSELLLNSITILEPTAWQLISSSTDVFISLTYSGGITPTALLGRFNGGQQFVVDAAPSGGASSGSYPLPKGNGDLEIWYENDPTVKSTQSNVAIGTKGLIWGQSNFSGRATNAQSFSERPGFFHKFTVSNNVWQEGADPFDGDTASGSLFPIFANLFVAEKNTPLGLVGVAEGSTALSQWQPGEMLNNRMLDYITNSGGDFEFIASWIGETDATNGTAEVTFKSEYNTVIDQLFTLTGVKSVLCGIAQAGTPSDNVRQWIQDIVATNPNALGYVDMASAYTGVHYESNAETFDCASLLFDGVQSAFYQSTLSMTMANIPDGSYQVTVTDGDLVMPTVRYSDQVTFTSETALVSGVEAAVGTRCYAIVRNTEDPSTEADVFTGVTA